MKKEGIRGEYSGLPSPQAYIKKQIKNEKINTKILLWGSYKKPKKRNKSIWDL